MQGMLPLPDGAARLALMVTGVASFVDVVDGFGGSSTGNSYLEEAITQRGRPDDRDLPCVSALSYPIPNQGIRITILVRETKTRTLPEKTETETLERNQIHVAIFWRSYSRFNQYKSGDYQVEQLNEF
jgi:hypothetical protein